jgi:hypothetical protein
MERDRTLYDGAYDRLTERGFFTALRMLLDVLEVRPGTKVVLLYSGPFRADGFHHDDAHRDVAARAARARAALYPIDAGGLRSPNGFRYGDLGGPRALARLAVDTGGRLTYHTNDLGLGYARAQRDVGCRYTLGFYLSGEEPDRPRRLVVRSRRAGLRVAHAAAWAPGGTEARRDGRLDGALAAPQLFPTGGFSVGVEPLEGEATRGVRVELRLPPDFRSPGTVDWRVVGQVTRRTGVVVQRFEATLGAETGGRLDLGPAVGLWARPHRATVVIASAVSDTPYAAWVDFEMPLAQPPRLESP